MCMYIEFGGGRGTVQALLQWFQRPFVLHPANEPEIHVHVAVQGCTFVLHVHVRDMQYTYVYMYTEMCGVHVHVHANKYVTVFDPYAAFYVI